MSTFSVQSLRPYKSLKRVDWRDVPNFSVVTGVNGSGKTHLLELIASSLGYHIEKSADGRDSKPGVVHGFPLATGDILYVQAEKSIQFKVSSSLRDIEELIDTLYRRPVNDPNGAWRASGSLYAGFSSKKGAQNEHQILTPSKDEFRERLTPSVISYGRLSGPNPDLALLFLSYAVLQAEARNRKMTDKQIVDQFGEAPWVLLNRIFELAELPFGVEAPAEPKPSVFSKSIEFELKLFDKAKGVTLSPNDLSAGEKVIVSMVFLHYTSEYGNSKYKLLLLDEPDTHLHPSFIKKYIRILTEVLVTEKQVRAVMTTHSPITVAIVPEAAIHNLDRSIGDTPLKVSRERALETLLQGVPSLSVRYEQRLPIFVESKFDVAYYEGLVKALRRLTTFFYEPVFLAPLQGLPS
ncbi:AAA family ATPase [Roseateles sp. LKC17W]|uniref:AAA family ATPase n=2 Tax=Pelomonas margarita TaxID=3299031 RepID=A0ABW7FDI7_9BURK